MMVTMMTNEDEDEDSENDAIQISSTAVLVMVQPSLVSWLTVGEFQKQVRERDYFLELVSSS